MHQISLVKSDSAVLTSEQRSAWTRRGFLVLKSHLTPKEVERLAASDPRVNEFTAAQEALVESLKPLVRELLEADPILLSFRRGLTESFGLDALDPASGPKTRGVTAVILLEPSPGGGWEHSFFAASHLIPEAQRSADTGSEMFRIAREIQDRGISRDRLSAAAGDVWLRHPRLMRGVLHRDGPYRAPTWLTAAFGRFEDLPREWASAGLRAGGWSARSVFPESRRQAAALGPGTTVG